MRRINPIAKLVLTSRMSDAEFAAFLETHPVSGGVGAVPVGYPGRGTQIGFSTLPLASPAVYVPMPQLMKFDRSGAKADTDDATCLDSPGNNKYPVPIVVDNGEYTAEGLYDPGNLGIVALEGYLQAMQQLGYKIVLTDGTTLVGLCYVGQFEAPKIDRYKLITFSFAIKIYGAEVLTPSGTGTPISE